METPPPPTAPGGPGTPPSPGASAPLSGVDKAAIVLLALGPEPAGAVLRCLDTADQVRLGQAMAAMTHVPRPVARDLLLELQTQAQGGPPVYADPSQIRDTFASALGSEQASHVIENFLPNVGAASIRQLRWVAPEDAAELIHNEHPQIIATIFAHLDADQAARILHYLPPPLRGEVILRLATLDRVRPAALQELDDALARILASSRAGPKVGGPSGLRAAADIVSLVDHQDEAAILAQVRAVDPAIADRLVLLFDHLARIDDRGLQLLIRQVDSEALVIALKATTPAVQERFFANMSADAAEMLKEELELRGAVRLVEVETAQRKVVALARKLAEEGRLTLPSANGSEYA